MTAPLPPSICSSVSKLFSLLLSRRIELHFLSMKIIKHTLNIKLAERFAIATTINMGIFAFHRDPIIAGFCQAVLVVIVLTED